MTLTLTLNHGHGPLALLPWFNNVWDRAYVNSVRYYVVKSPKKLLCNQVLLCKSRSTSVFSLEVYCSLRMKAKPQPREGRGGGWGTSGE